MNGEKCWAPVGPGPIAALEFDCSSTRRAAKRPLFYGFRRQRDWITLCATGTESPDTANINGTGNSQKILISFLLWNPPECFVDILLNFKFVVLQCEERNYLSFSQSTSRC